MSCNGPPPQALRFHAEVTVGAIGSSGSESAGLASTMLTSPGLELEPAPSSRSSAASSGGSASDVTWRPLAAPGAALSAADGLFAVLSANGTLTHFGSDPLALSSGLWPPQHGPRFDNDGISIMFALRSGHLAALGSPRHGSPLAARPTADLQLIASPAPVEDVDLGSTHMSAVVLRHGRGGFISWEGAFDVHPNAVYLSPINANGAPLAACRGVAWNEVAVLLADAGAAAPSRIRVLGSGAPLDIGMFGATTLACDRQLSTICAVNATGVFCYGNGMDPSYASRATAARRIQELPAGAAVLKMRSWTSGYMCAILATGAAADRRFAADGTPLGSVYCWGTGIIAGSLPTPRLMFGITAASDLACIPDRCIALLGNGSMV